jgi:hypothetical protein
MFSRNGRVRLAVLVLGAVTTASRVGAQTEQVVHEPDAGFNPAAVAGLYQMLDPRGYADALTAATYLRLLPDGRSRTEGVRITDEQGVIAATTEIGLIHELPWAVRSGAGGKELCFDVAGKLQCGQMERDLATGDLLLYDTARPRGRPDLRLHRVTSAVAIASQ